MLTLRLEVIELLRRLPANPLPRAEDYSTFEAHGSFPSLRSGPCGLQLKLEFLEVTLVLCNIFKLSFPSKATSFFDWMDWKVGIAWILWRLHCRNMAQERCHWTRFIETIVNVEGPNVGWNAISWRWILRLFLRLWNPLTILMN